MTDAQELELRTKYFHLRLSVIEILAYEWGAKGPPPNQPEWQALWDAIYE